MTQYNASAGGSDQAGASRTSTLVVSHSGLHWPAIISGVFLTLTLFIIAAVLSQAVGLDFTFNSIVTTGGEVGTIIWGGAAALICFGLGAYLAARVARGTLGAGSAMLNGFVVWAVTVPILIYVLGGGIGPMLGKKAPALSAPGAQAAMTEHNAMPAATAHQATHANDPAMSVTMSAPAEMSTMQSTGHYQASAWWMLVSIGCGLVGALLCGMGGTHTDRADEAHSAQPQA